jgi:hypothetical protein
MSGSNSSSPDDVSAHGLDLTVHAAPTDASVQALRDAEQTRRGRLMMVVVVLLCALPVLASYFTFYVVKPKGQAYGSLITPSVDLPADLPLRNLAGEPVAADSLRQQWLLVVVDGGSCVAECENHLYMQRQLREMLGRERDRLDKVWLVTDDVPLQPALRDALAAHPATTVLRVPADALARWLQPDTGQPLSAHLYLVDPLGRWMWRSPTRPDPMKVKKDLERVLKASASWDQPGRPQ